MKLKTGWKIKKHFHLRQVILFFILIIFILGVFMLVKFNKKVTPKLLEVAEASINKLNETILTNYRVKDIYPQVDLESAIVLTKNSKEEIISVDFNL